MRIRIAFLFTGLLLAVLPASAYVVRWRDAIDPNVNLSVATAGTGSVHEPSACSDGRGGMWVAYRETLPLDYFRLSRVKYDGQNLSASNPLPAFAQTEIAVAPGDSGGVVVVWRDARNNAASGADIYAQYYGPDGLRRWGATGVQITNAAGDQYRPMAMRSSYGYVIGWLDDRNGAGNTDIYLARITAAGVLQSSLGGEPLATHASDQTEVVFAPAEDGLLVAWVDTRLGTADIYAEKYSALGFREWGFGSGIAVCTATGAQGTPTLCSDGDGGALVFWDDGRGADLDVYGQRIAASGEAQWGSNGALVSGATLNQFDPAATSDGQGGAILAWFDDRSSPRELYAQRVLSYGVPLWTANGVAVASASAGAPSDMRILGDDLGGAYVVWSESRTGQLDLFGQRFSSTGAAQWGTSGATLSAAAGSQTLASLALGDDNSLLATWQDTRGGVGTFRVLAQRVDRFGFLGDASPLMVDVSDVPGDQGGRVRLDWEAGYVEFDPFLQVASYYVLRQVPATFAMAAQRAGARLTREPATPEPGERVVLERPLAGQATYWEYIGQAPAFQSSTYSFVAPTTSDSVPGVPASTQFMVQARNSSGSRYWFSLARVGSSLDNLAPLAPAPFAGVYASGSTRLAWNPNREADLAGYRLYRDTSADFTPGPASLVATVADTGYTDAVGAPFVYKLTAVDVHGNESPVAMVVPAGTTGVDERPTPRLALASPAPNPASHGTVIRFSLPHASNVRLDVLDVSGRGVRVIEERTRDAGDHASTWDLADGSGRAVAPGLYFVRLRTAAGTLSRRVLVSH